MKITQKNLVNYLSNNPLGTKVEVGSVKDMGGHDYILINYLYERLIGSDNKGIYSTVVQFTVFTKDFDNRKTLVDFIKDKFNVTVDYDWSNEYQYYQATLETTLMLAKDIEGQEVV